MAFVHVQGGFFNGTGATNTLPITISAVGSGNTVVGSWTQNDNSLTLPTVTDDKGNNYTVLGSTHNASIGWIHGYFVLGNITNGPSTITVNFNTTEGFRSIVVDEYSGAIALTDPTDGHAINPQTAPTSLTTDFITSGSITTTANGDLIWSATMADQNHLATHGTGFTPRENVTTQTGLQSEDLVQTSAGAIAGTWTATSTADNTSTAVIAIKPVVVIQAGSPGILGLASSEW